MDATLPHGMIVNGKTHRAVSLRPLTGRDEEFLLDHARTMLPAERDTAVLTRCAVRIGPYEDVTADHVRGLCLGDRQALLLALCSASAGSVLDSTVVCPSETCGEQLEVAVEVSDLVGREAPEPAEQYEAVLSEGDTTVRVRLRLPDGWLLEAASRLDPDEGEALLVDDVVQEVYCGEQRLPRLPTGLEGQIAEAIELLDPLAEMRLEVTCPSCGTTLVAVLDAGEYLMQQAMSDQATFHAEVHLLASRYHWSEREILSLPVSKRRLYVGLIEAAGAEVWA